MKEVPKDDCRAILTRTREILSDPDRWTQGAVAVDAKGQSLSSPIYRKAVSWCLMGACAKAAYDLGLIYDMRSVAHALRPYAPSPYEDVTRFNDSRHVTHDKVLLLIDRSLERQEEAA